MNITVAICTWDRCELLRQTLEQMRNLEVPQGVEWELLIVNNNSTDSTNQVIASFSDRLPIRRLFEPKQGHSNARNCALHQARGEYILWTDDDVLVDRKWVAEYWKALNKYPDAAFFGGVIEPYFAVEPPSWIRRHIDRLAGAFAIRDLGRDILPFQDDEVPYGANMAFKTEILKKFTFNPRLGRIGSGMLGDDELEVITRLRQSGLYGVWVGTARVKHHIEVQRLTKKYLWEFYRGVSRTQCRRSEPSTTAARYMWNAPRWAIRKYCECLLKTFVFAPFKGKRWLSAFMAAAYYRAVIDEARERRLQPIDLTRTV
jgi:glycosyltransferase involved in cell wall biosynthesis